MTSRPVGQREHHEDVQFPYALTSVSAIPATRWSVPTSTPRTPSSRCCPVDHHGLLHQCHAHRLRQGLQTLDRSQDNVLAGQTFTYSASATFDGAPVTVPSSVSVVAADFGTTTARSSPTAAPRWPPLGSLVTFTETNLPPTIQSVGTTVSPPV